MSLEHELDAEKQVSSHENCMEPEGTMSDKAKEACRDCVGSECRGES